MTLPIVIKTNLWQGVVWQWHYRLVVLRWTKLQLRICTWNRMKRQTVKMKTSFHVRIGNLILLVFIITKVWFFHLQSNQIWSPIYWSPINLMFRTDRQSTVFRFSMHFWSPVTWSAISWSVVNRAYFMPIWLADGDLNLRCCAKLPSMRCERMP